ncbi:hypothetical protein H4W80_011417 [Nonomuraea angiospora]|uniref:Uncharacterized protein n=1 Tax=Nonomuraea angiospora TaxID=46172 RepID=A0ABR9MK74_9ACTN|nr:hypothetical protein [Nonomuraea angiospora]
MAAAGLDADTEMAIVNTSAPTRRESLDGIAGRLSAR